MFSFKVGLTHLSLIINNNGDNMIEISCNGIVVGHIDHEELGFKESEWDKMSQDDKDEEVDAYFHINLGWEWYEV